VKKRPIRKPTLSHEYDGKQCRSASELAKAFDIKIRTLTYRLRQGRSLDAALGHQAAPERNERVTSFEVEGKRYRGAVELCAAYSVSVNTFRYRQKAGWTLRQALDLDPAPSRAKVTYLVTRPDGVTVHVEDWTAFATREGPPRNGDASKAVAYRDKLHSWRGWGCRKIDPASGDSETDPVEVLALNLGADMADDAGDLARSASTARRPSPRKASRSRGWIGAAAAITAASYSSLSEMGIDRARCRAWTPHTARPALRMS
jgi:hypothetical protein